VWSDVFRAVGGFDDSHPKEIIMKDVSDFAAVPAPCDDETVGRSIGVPVMVDGRPLDVSVVPLGPASLVLARTPTGVLACGAIDPVPLGRLGIAAARVRPTRGPSVTDLEDLLAGEVTEANSAAKDRGVSVGMSGREAVALL
jgi:uncharacterized protein YunC (DUF1805 family)